MIVTVLAASLAACSVADPEPPLQVPAEEQGQTTQLELVGRVVDAAELLSPDEETTLTAQLASIEDDTLAQLVVVTVPSLGGEDISDFSRNLGNRWGVGHRDRNDGLLLVVAPNERRLRIQVGFGLEERIPDSFAADVVEDVVTYFPGGDWYGGISEGVDQLGERLRATTMREAA